MSHRRHHWRDTHKGFSYVNAHSAAAIDACVYTLIHVSCTDSLAKKKIRNTRLIFVHFLRAEMTKVVAQIAIIAPVTLKVFRTISSIALLLHDRLALTRRRCFRFGERNWIAIGKRERLGSSMFRNYCFRNYERVIRKNDMYIHVLLIAITSHGKSNRCSNGECIETVASLLLVN